MNKSIEVICAAETSTAETSPNWSLALNIRNVRRKQLIAGKAMSGDGGGGDGGGGDGGGGDGGGGDGDGGGDDGGDGGGDS